MKRNILKIRIFILFIFLFLPFSSALGIAPAKKEIVFQPGFEQSFTGLIVNQEQNEITVLLKENDPYDILSIQEESITFSEGEYEKMFSYTIQLPESLSEYGELATIQAQVETDSTKGIQTILVLESKIIILAPIEASSETLVLSAPEEILVEDKETLFSLPEQTVSSFVYPLIFLVLFSFCLILLSIVLRQRKERKKRQHMLKKKI